MMKRTLSLLFALCFLMCPLIGCKKGGGTPVATMKASTDNETEDPVLAALPKTDLGGKKMTILSFTEPMDSDDPNVYNENTISSVKHSRTLYAEDRYNITIQYVKNENVYEALTNDRMADGQSFDLALPHPTEGIASILTSGYCTNYLELNSIDTSSPWYNQSQVESYTINGKLYPLVSDIGVDGAGFQGFVYNKDLYLQNNNGEDNLYETVFNGDWTLEVFMETMKKFHPENEGVPEEEKMYSLIYHSKLERTFMYGIGQKTVRRNSEGLYELALDKGKLNTLAENLYDLIYNMDNVYVAKQTFYAGWGTCDMVKIFKAQKAIFFEYDIGGLYNYLRDVTFKIGYLPMPKFDTYQQGYALICGQVGTIIPSTLNEKEDAALLLDTFSRYSYLYLKPAFYDEVLLGRMSPTADDYKMLELLHNSKVYDIGFTIDGAGMGPLKGIMTEVVLNNRSKSVDSYLMSKNAVLLEIVDVINNIK